MNFSHVISHISLEVSSGWFGSVSTKLCCRPYRTITPLSQTEPSKNQFKPTWNQTNRLSIYVWIYIERERELRGSRNISRCGIFPWSSWL